MPKAYGLVQPREDKGPYRYMVGGLTRLTVPWVNCPDCEGTSGFGLRYSSLDISGLGEEIIRHLRSYDPSQPKQSQFDGPRSLDIAALHELRKSLDPILGPERPWGPGTDLGPLCGTAEGTFDDLTWTGSDGSLLVRRSVFDAMRKAGFAISGHRPELAYRRERRDPLVDLEVLPTAHLHRSQQPEVCGTCGFGKTKAGRISETAVKKVKLDAATFDETIPLQRVLERAEIMLANEALADFIRAQGLADVRLIPMRFA